MLSVMGLTKGSVVRSAMKSVSTCHEMYRIDFNDLLHTIALTPFLTIIELPGQLKTSSQFI